jgi:hypothetical protein
MSEVLLLCYNFLKWAVRDGCNTLVLRPQEAAWCRDGRELDRFSFAGVKLSRSLPVVMARILAHDVVVRRHLTLVNASHEEIIYRLG